MLKKLILLCLVPLSLFAQEKSEPDLWEPFSYFVGPWIGHETGKAGIGKGEREYKFVLNDQYLFCQNKSTFEPQPKNPKGERHEDWSFLSYDDFQKTFVLREFHTEGFVNLYKLDSLSTTTKFIFISESSENAPPGLRARLTLEIKNENEFVETFELAMPGKNFAEYLKNYWIRDDR